MKNKYPKNLHFFLVLLLILVSTLSYSQVDFEVGSLDFTNGGSVKSGTSLMFGPDGRLYVAEYRGLIKIFDIQRNGPGDYEVISEEVLTVQDIQNHNDDGTEYSDTKRETTGITVGGTSTNPVIYVSSSDFRVGGGTGGGDGDENVDTNSGTITRFTWNGASWDVVDLVRGLPRSEENHATNGLELATIGGTNYLIVASGGHTNCGSPGANFAYLTEYALSAAILSVDLDYIDALSTQVDGNGRSYKYDLPTLDDPTRDNVNGITDPDDLDYDGIDINDPFGGNDGLNQAKIVPDGPVQIFSPGYRNAYDFAITESGAVYITDNGPNGGWGGVPNNEGTALVDNDYVVGEPGGSSGTAAPDGEYASNKDHLTLVTTDMQNYTFGDFYGGHPAPIRANPSGAGLFTAPEPSGTNNAVFRTQLYDPDGSRAGSTTDSSIALPADWPPVPVGQANLVEGNYRDAEQPNPDGIDDIHVTIWDNNTNGLDEYTSSSSFGGEMQGDLIAGNSDGILFRVELNPDGSLLALTELASGLSGITNLGVTCNSDTDPFPGTIWIAPYSTEILVLEPKESVVCINQGEVGYDGSADYDSDGYTNDDEIANGTDHCNGGSRPNDFDSSIGGTLVSDLNDPDDDGDGILDADDPFQLGDPDSVGSDAFELPVENELLSGDPDLKGYDGLGMTGLMNNGAANPNWLDWIDNGIASPNPNDILGGATGLMTMQMTSGTALGGTNTQEKAFQYGVQVDQTTGIFTVSAAISNLTDPIQLYGNGSAPNGELGIYIGDGTQSDYIKFVATQSGLEGLQEIGDASQAPVSVAIATGNRPSSAITFYMVVDPSTGEVLLQYDFDASGTRTDLGTITAQGNVLQAIQQAGTDLAVGLIGTSNAPGVELEGTWEFLYVFPDEPFIQEQLPDIDQFANAADDTIDLTSYFNDDNGAANLTYTVESNTSAELIADTNGTHILTIEYPSVATVGDIIVRATDGGGLFVEQTFTVTVSDAPVVLYRVNTGGPEITAIDGGLDWEEDNPNGGTNSAYLSEPGSNQTSAVNINSHTYDPEISLSTTPTDIFKRGRFDNAQAPEMSYSFPVGNNGNYEIRLYVAEGFVNTSEAGERVFDVTIKGIPLPDLTEIDLSGTYGYRVATVLSHVVNINDGFIDIEFLHGVENPIINGIEILDVSDTDTPIYVHQLEDQRNAPGEELDGSLGPLVSGGDGNLNFSVSGLPNGISIDPTNGQLGGTIDEEAEDNSPYTVTYTIDDEDSISSDAVTMTFTWYTEAIRSYRVNSGGNKILATDVGVNWENNSDEDNQVGEYYEVNTGKIVGFGGVITYENRDSSIPAYIDEDTFDSLYANERYDLPGGEEMEYSFIVPNGDYTVNLYFGNSFDQTNEIGDRTFDIVIEGNVVENDFDIVAQFGDLVGGLMTYQTTVADGELNIGFNHEVENPAVNGVEIYFEDAAFTDLSIQAIGDTQNFVSENVNIQVNAEGGDPSKNFSYYIAGQPAGLSINSLTGLISGTIDSSALSGGQNGDGLHNVIVTITKPGSAPVNEYFEMDLQTAWVDKDEDETYTGRHECSFVQAGDRFYLMGGRESSQTVDIYNYAANSWTALNNSAPSVFNHFQAVEYGGLIWVIGAFTSNGFPNEPPAEHVWMFDPSTNEWIEGPEIPASRRRGSAGLAIYNDKFYLVGGNTIGHNGGYVNWFDEYDPATGTWTTLDDAPHARDHFHAAVVGDKLYAAGGRLSGGDGGTFAPTIPEVDVYDFVTGTWSTLDEDIPTPRGASTSVNFNDKLVVIGGEVQGEEVYGEVVTDALKITEQYDPVTEVWTRLEDLNNERHGTQAIVSGAGIFITAGSPKIGGGTEGNQKNMEFYGEDAPVGSPSTASTLDAPTEVVIADGTTENIDLNISGGTVGIPIRSMELSGPDAGSFNIDTGELTNGFILPNTTHQLAISLNGSSAQESATFTVNYGESSSIDILLSNNSNFNLDVGNPGTQFNIEGDMVSLQIEATSGNNITNYSATGLPPNLTIDSNTGEISGTIASDTSGNPPFLESGGLVVIEAESGELEDDWNEVELGGETCIIAGSNNLGDAAAGNGGTIPYQITISTPGIYRINWNSLFTGDSNSERNDAWLRFPNDDDVWFFGQQFAGNENSMMTNLQGDQDNVVFPKGSSRITTETTPDGNGGNGFFKVFRSGGDSEVLKWQAVTSDGNGHRLYVWFVNAGTYTMEVSERSLGHAIDRIVLYKKDGPSYTDAELSALPESERSGAAANSPYEVSVTVEDGGDPVGSETVEFNWIIGEAGELVAIPEADTVEGEAPLTVNFTGSNSTDDIGVSSYLWDFDDGGATSTDADPTYIFNTAGVYEVELTVGDIDGNSDTNSITINVNEPNGSPVAVASATPEEGDAPLEVSFTGSSSTDDVAVTGYSWDFGDGNGSTDADPIHTYTIAGNYTATLTVTDAGGLTDMATVDITVNEPNGSPVAVASATPEEGDAPLEVSFTGSSSTDDVAVTGYSWDFGDGNGSTDADPTHTYTIAGNYTATLTVTDAGGLTDMATVDITVNEPNGSPVAVASATPEEGDAPLEVSFTGSSSTDDVAVTGYSWDFGDGNGSTDADPIHTYTIAGNYTATLTVTDAGGLTDMATVDITVNEPNGSPVAVASATPEEGDAPLEVSFTGSSSTDDVAVTGYSWDFGDGNGSTDADPTHTYTIAGNYTATLTVTDAGGLTDMATVDIIVNTVNLEAPVAVAMANPLEGEAPLAIIFDGSGSTDNIGIVSYAWDFKDGTTSSEVNPVTTFETPGVYNVDLTVTDGDGLEDTTTVIITVNAPNESPIAIASAAPLNGEAPLQVDFNGSASTDDSAVVSYSWDFKDGNFSNEADPTHTFTSIGTFDVSLTVTDDNGATDSAIISITVQNPQDNEAPVAVVSAAPESGNAPLEVSFTGSNSTDDVGVTSYLWDFGDGNSSTEADPTHTYTVAGNYTATLTVTDAGGLTAMAAVDITVNEPNGSPVAVASATPEEGDAPLEVSFTGSNSTDDVEVTSYSWDFGDGNSSSEPNPVNVYTFAGTFEASLTVEDEEGLTDVATVTIVVEDNNVAENGELQIILAPNPATEVAQVRIMSIPSGITVTNIHLHDSSGRLIGTFDPEEVSIDSNSYGIPIYMLRDELYYLKFEMSSGEPYGIRLLVKN
ncbi:PKD domain-containing protein [Flagellimonas eckloniae]|uniref:PKD domain-containing protein n=1 Tax=Flagellimonas eckloniae TaxID=346185 RepID=UPI0006DCCEEB|nr:PKD domain-containing protein [Allomuricauda eckloniae]